MDHESEISFANRIRTSYRVNVSVITSRCRVLDGVPSWVNGSSERDGEAKRNRDSGTSRLTGGTDTGPKTRNNGQGLAYSSAGEAEGISGPRCGDNGTSRLT
jgi:hypothetical protein